MTVTKSIRLDLEELARVQATIELMPGASEAGALKHLLLLGVAAQNRDQIVLLYTRDRMSTGEIAERLGVSRLDVLHVLEERRVKVLDTPVEAFQADLERTTLPGSVARP